MKKCFLIISFFLSLLSCKSDKKKSDDKPIMVEIPSDNETKIKSKTKPIKTLLDYISFGNKTNAISVDDEIEGIIAIDDVSLFKEEESKKVFMVMKLSEDLQEGLYGRYRVMAIMFPYNIDDIKVKYSIDNNLDHEIWYYDLKTHLDKDGNKYLWGQVANDIDEFKKVMLRIVNLDTGEVLKKQIVINDLETE